MADDDDVKYWRDRALRPHLRIDGIRLDEWAKFAAFMERRSRRRRALIGGIGFVVLATLLITAYAERQPRRQLPDFVRQPVVADGIPEMLGSAGLSCYTGIARAVIIEPTIESQK